LFLMHSPAHVRNFESVLRTLVGRGHRVTVLFEERKERGDEAGLALIRRLSAEYDELHHELRSSPPPGVRGRLRLALEALQDYLRYLDPPYAEARRLRARALAFLPARFERGLASALRAWPRGRRRLGSIARRAARALGTDSRIRDELMRHRPGVVIASPLVHFRSRQRDWVRAAADVGIGTLFCVYSWDNLTNRGLMHARPDRIAVWNDAQRNQVIVLHGARPDTVEVTGAWPYDHWFGWRESRSRTELCGQLGLDAGRAVILYACSSRFIAEREWPAVVEWLRVLRSSPDSRVATANVIVRPHPLNGDEWRDCSPRHTPGLAVFPPGGADPVDAPSRTDYFDSIRLADAVVGVNTSVLIESAILDRPALAFPAPYFRSSQDELPHFRELIGEAGILRVSSSMDEHLSQLSEALAGPSEGSALRRRFVNTAIRPRGDSPSPSERVATAVEELLAASRR
jgi:hypothetical protein